MRTSIATVKLDLVVGVMGPALGFLLRHGEAAFPGVPVIFCGADAADIRASLFRPTSQAFF